MNKMTITHDELFREWFDSASLVEIEVEDALSRIAAELQRIVKNSGLHKQEITRRTGSVSESAINRIFAMTRGASPTIEEIVRLARACGYTLNVNFTILEDAL